MEMDYEDIAKAIGDAPDTYIPALMSKAVAEAKRRGVFMSDEALKKTVHRIIEHENKKI